MVDLEFGELDAAEKFHEKLRQLWAGYGDAVMRNPEVWLVETVETKSL